MPSNTATALRRKLDLERQVFIEHWFAERGLDVKMRLHYDAGALAYAAENSPTTARKRTIIADKNEIMRLCMTQPKSIYRQNERINS